MSAGPRRSASSFSFSFVLFLTCPLEGLVQRWALVFDTIDEDTRGKEERKQVKVEKVMGCHRENVWTLT